jgi:hypothetical protein
VEAEEADAVGFVVFYAVFVVSKESRRLALPRTFFSNVLSVESKSGNNLFIIYIFYFPQSQSHITTDGQSVNPYWC